MTLFSLPAWKRRASRCLLAIFAPWRSPAIYDTGTYLRVVRGDLPSPRPGDRTPSSGSATDSQHREANRGPSFDLSHRVQYRCSPIAPRNTETDHGSARSTTINVLGPDRHGTERRERSPSPQDPRPRARARAPPRHRRAPARPGPQRGRSRERRLPRLRALRDQCRRLQLPYIARWSGGDLELVRSSAERVITCARSIIDAILTPT